MDGVTELHPLYELGAWLGSAVFLAWTVTTTTPT